LAGDTARAATSGEVKDLRREAQELKAVVAEQALELRLLKKSMIGDEQSNAGRRVLRARSNNLARKRKDQTEHNPKSTLAASEERRLN